MYNLSARRSLANGSDSGMFSALIGFQILTVVKVR